MELWRIQDVVEKFHTQPADAEAHNVLMKIDSQRSMHCVFFESQRHVKSLLQSVRLR